MARILVCFNFRDGIFWGAMLVSWRVVLPSFSHSGPKWYNCVVASKGSDFLSQLVYVLVLFVVKFGYQSETMMILNIMILAARSRGFSREVLSTTPHAFDAFFFRNCPSEYDMIWMDNFGIRKSTQFPCTSHQFLLYHIYTSNVWLQPVTYAGRLNLSSWLAISSSGGLSSRILGFALMTVCVCNPVSMSPGKNLRSYLVKRILRENHMSHRQGNHFDS